MAEGGNNFDFIRVLAAFCVLVSHQFALSGSTEPAPLPFHSWGGIGVLAFFVVSGFLVAMSWESDPHPIRFALRRALRIWPAWIVVTAVSALLLGPLVTALSVEEYFSSSVTWSYFLQLVFSTKDTLPGVFETNPFRLVVNGSLWTLPIELQLYGLLLVAGVATLLRRRWVVLAAVILSAFYYFAVVDVETNRKWTREFSLFFSSGVCLFLFRDFWRPRLLSISCCLLVASIGLWSSGFKYAAIFVLAPMLLIAFGLSSWPVLRRFGRYGDVSYGLYIYAFPVQQTLIYLTDNTLPVTPGILLSLVVTLIFAFLSCHLVERPALRWKSRVKRIAFPRFAVRAFGIVPD